MVGIGVIFGGFALLFLLNSASINRERPWLSAPLFNNCVGLDLDGVFLGRARDRAVGKTTFSEAALGTLDAGFRLWSLLSTKAPLGQMYGRCELIGDTESVSPTGESEADNGGLMSGRKLLFDLRFLNCEMAILGVTLGRAAEREPGKKK